ncbi:MAG TPA: hypothetical protein VID48_13375, partial [Solirubrobacteraceae bacterium]
MSRSLGLASRRVLFSAMASLLLGLSCAAASARAATIEANCTNLQERLNTAEAGETLTLDGVCQGGFTLPSKVAFTLEGKAGTSSGFDGSLGSPELLLDGGEVGILTVRNLTFEHASGAGEGAALHLTADTAALTQLTLDHDSFLHNSTTGSHGGALVIYTGSCSGRTSGSLAITNSLFEGNQVNDTTGSPGGGAVDLSQDCEAISTTLSHDVFRGNSVNVTAQDGSGGAVLLSNYSPGLPPVLQTDNTFDSNSITNTGAPGSYSGGGEWTVGFQVSSTGDSYTNNSLPGSGAGTDSSEGAGLGTVNTTCNVEKSNSATTTAVNLVAAANKIGSSAEGTSEGAGLYAGCGTGVGFEQLTLEDSTVTGNVSSGGTAGVNGEETDHLTLKNSIVYGNSGGADLGGFAGVGGSLAATYSDVCSGTAPLTGVGNICAAPQLASPSTGDVHETGSSPTIDAGSNPLVPSGLSTDVFGGERILAGHLGCTVENPKVVDIGADEFIPPVPPCVPMIVPPPFFPKPALASLVKLKLGPTSATLKITCKGTSTQ